MDESQRSKLLEGLKILNLQFEDSAEQVRGDLAAGMSTEDILAGGIVEFSKADSGYLASVIMARLIKEAKMPVRKTRKTAVPAKRAKIAPEVPDAVA